MGHGFMVYGCGMTFFFGIDGCVAQLDIARSVWPPIWFHSNSRLLRISVEWLHAPLAASSRAVFFFLCTIPYNRRENVFMCNQFLQIAIPTRHLPQYTAYQAPFHTPWVPSAFLIHLYLFRCMHCTQTHTFTHITNHILYTYVVRTRRFVSSLNSVEWENTNNNKKERKKRERKEIDRRKPTTTTTN